MKEKFIMKVRTFKYDSSDSESEGKDIQDKASSSSKPEVPTFYKKLLQGDTGGLIKEKKSEAIKQKRDAIENTISEAQNIEGIKVLLEENNKKAINKESSDIPKEYRWKMLNQAVHPEEFMKRFHIAKQSFLEVQSFVGKSSTKQDIKGYLLIWDREREQLGKLVHQMNKDPGQVRSEVEEAFPGLQKEAQRTLDRLERIPNWQTQLDQFKPQTREKALLSRKLVEDYLSADGSAISQESPIEKDLWKDGSLDKPRVFAELSYRTKILSKLIDKLSPTESAESRWQGSPEKTLKELVNEVAKLDMSKSSGKTALRDAIYELCGVNENQQRFTTTPSESEYKEFTANIAVREDMKRSETELGWIFFKDGKLYEKEGRVIANLHPDAMLNGKTRGLVEKASQLGCVHTIKLAAGRWMAMNKLDPVIIYFDMTDSSNKDLVAECLRPFAEFTRPGLPVGVEPIYNGIGYASQSVVKRGAGLEGGSWGTVIANSVADVAWALKAKDRPITFETLWPRVESDLRKKGLIEI